MNVNKLFTVWKQEFVVTTKCFLLCGNLMVATNFFPYIET